MTPILYEKDEIDFTSQGLGALAEIYDVDVAEQRNGLFQLTANYPVTGIRYDDISVGRIILAKPNQRDEPHAFRIVNTELDVMGYSLMIEADSITYDLNHNFIKHLTANDATGQVMMSAIQAAIVNPSIFTFYSDINHKSSTKLDYVNPMEAVMGVQGSFLQYWGGELKRENRRVAMFNRRGRDNVATFRLGKNISGLKYKVDISSLVTRIMPVKSVQENDKTTYLEGTPVSSKYINNYEQIYTIKVDFTDDAIKTVDDLNKAAEGWFVDSANTGRDKPSVTIDIDVLSLQDSADYQDKFKNLESVALTDTVTVYVPEYGVNVTAIVNEIHFDPIQERVTKLVVGTARHSFADSSRVQLSDLQDKVTLVKEQADQIAVSANNKNSNYYGSVAPSHPQQGDLWYWKDGDLSGIKQFVNGEWVDLVDSNTQQQIADSVNKAVSDAQKYSDKLVADNAEQIAAQIQSVKESSQELAESIQKEVVDRAAAVTEIDNKAKDYADTAKADAISAATTADGVINKKIDETASSITRTISQNKTDIDGKISTAQTAATQALNEVSTKVSKTEYDTKTGQLQTDLNQTTATANQAKTDIVSIKQKDDSQDARMLSIETDANGTKTTVSALQTTQGQQSGAISSLQQRADGFEATVNKVNNMAVGGRNLLLNSKSLWGVGGNNQVTWTIEDFDATTKMWHLTSPQSGWLGVGIYFYQPDKTSYQLVKGDKWAFSFDIKGTGTFQTYGSENSADYSGPTGDVPSDWKRVFATGEAGATNAIILYFETRDKPLDVYIKLPKLELGNIPTQWTPAPEDQESAISQVRADIRANAKAIMTKVSQSDYNTKTGQIDSQISLIEQTATGINQTVTSVQSQVNGLSVGGRNVYLNSKTLPDSIGVNGNSNVTVTTEWADSEHTTKMWHIVSPQNNGTGVGIYIWGYADNKITTNSYWSYSAEIKGTGRAVNFGIENGQKNPVVGNIGSDWSRISQTGYIDTNLKTIIMYFDTTNAPLDVYIKLPKLEQGNMPTAWTPAPEDIESNMSTRLTQTADSILALVNTKTDVSTVLALLKDNWSIGIADNAGKLASGVFGDINGMTLNGKTVTINANQTVITGTAFITDAMISTMSASKLTAGTIDASNVNVTNINASNIVSGAISGANLNINLNTGQVVFQRGRIYNPSVDETGLGQGGIDVNIDKRYLASSNGESVSMLSNGRLSLIERTLFTGTDSTPYFEISNSGDTFDWRGAALTGTEKIVLTTKGDTGGLFHDGRYLNGLIIDKKSPAQLGGLTNGVTISGGQGYTDVFNFGYAPSINVGVDKGGKSTSEIHMYSSWIRASAVEERTTSAGANVYVASDGTLVRSSSSSKYKLDIEYEQQVDTANKLLTLDPATWHDKFESEQLNKFHEIGVDPERAIDMSNRRYYGIIAEDLVKAGLEHLVSRNVMTGEVEGVEYSKIGVALIPMIRELRNRLNEQFVEIERLKEQLNEQHPDEK